MSGSAINSIENELNIGADGLEKDININTADDAADEESTGGSGWNINFDWLRTPTGDGEIEEYKNHILNPKKSEGMAHVLRGLTGFAGNLKLALIDIAIGVIKLWKGSQAGE